MSGKSFNNQAYVIWRNFILPGKRTTSDISDKKFPRNNAGAMVHKVIGNYHPSEIISKMFKPKRFDLYKDFLDLETHKLSSLVPEYRFYKIEEDTKVRTPFYFQTAVDEISRHSILEIPTTRAVGVSSFSVEFVGKDTATAKKMLNFNLELFSDNMKNIFADPPPGYAKIAELFTIFRNKTSLKKSANDNTAKPASQVKTASSSEIAVDLGYTIPRAARDLFTPSEIRTIESLKLSLRLTYTNHDINLESDGRTRISITYTGRIHSTLNEASFDLLSTKEDLIALAGVRSKNSDQNSNSKPDQVKKNAQQKQAEKRIKTAERRSFFRDVLETLEKKGLLYDYNLTKEDMNQLHRFQKDYEAYLEEEKEQAKATDESKTPAKEKNKTDSTPLDKTVLKTVSYFHIGDLIMQVSELFHKKLEASKKALEDSKQKDKKEKIKQIEREIKALKNTKILTSNMYVKVDSPMEESISVVNIADIPISLSLFNKHYFDNVEQNHAMSLTMYTFLKNLKNLILASFKNHVYKDAKFLDAKVSIKTQEVTGESIQDSKDKVNTDSLPSFLKSTVKKIRPNECDYFIIYPDHAADISLSRRGSRLSDLKDGIYHFYLGRDRGVLKEVKFSKMDIMYRKEALIVKSVSLYDQLKMPYNASVSMFGNMAFLPGSLFFIDPSSVGMGDPRETNSAAFQLGLGGYYQATSVSISFNGTNLTTDVRATQVSWAEDETDLVQQLDSYIDVKNVIGSL